MDDHMHLELTTTVATIRVYDHADGYALRLPYAGIMTVTYLSNKLAYLSGACGSITREMYDEAFAMLKAQGVEEVMIERRGEMKKITL